MLIPAETKQLLRALIKWHNAMRHSLNCSNKSRQTNHLDHRNPFNSINAQPASELSRLKACAVRSLVGLGVKFCLKPRARGKKAIRTMGDVKQKQEIAIVLFGAAQLTVKRAWPPFLFNVRMCASSDKKPGNLTAESGGCSSLLPGPDMDLSTWWLLLALRASRQQRWQIAL